MPVIALLTDFGNRDHFVGAMKGVIWNITPDVKIADISHEIEPQNIPQAALMLSRVVSYFPDGTVFVIVVDPGVGTDRRPLAARIGNQYFVSPDNGVLSYVYEMAEFQNWPILAVILDQPQYWLSNVSQLFHGRDIFAPVGAHLASGVPLEELGSPLNKLIRFDVPKPVRSGSMLVGEINYVDHFGNISSNITSSHLKDWIKDPNKILIRIGGQEIRGLTRAFGDNAPGTLTALIGSSGNLVISVVNGSAGTVLGSNLGDSVEVSFNIEAG